jgi:hypothetical protein
MSWLLFLDESGHDHQHAPFEVRGGIAIHSIKLWDFIRAVQERGIFYFGDLIHKYKSEIKGTKLLNREKFRWAKYFSELDDETRRRKSLAFLNAGVEDKKPRRVEFAAFGQACIMFSHAIFDLIYRFDAYIFATMIPRGISKPKGFEYEDFLRKDLVFLFERFYNLLHLEDSDGLIVMDETDKVEDRKFVKQIQNYFTRT